MKEDRDVTNEDCDLSILQSLSFQLICLDILDCRAFWVFMSPMCHVGTFYYSQGIARHSDYRLYSSLVTCVKPRSLVTCPSQVHCKCGHGATELLYLSKKPPVLITSLSGFVSFLGLRCLNRRRFSFSFFLSSMR